nr:transporter substrate-binding domain-containing protein [Desulfovibrio sp. JC010]
MLLIAFILFSATGSHAEQTSSRHIKIVFGYKFPPFYTVTSKKEPSKSLRGLFIDMMDDFNEQYPEYEFEYKCLPRARISKLLSSGKADAFALTDPIFISSDAKSQYSASLPMWTIGDHLLVRRDSPITKTDLNYLYGRTITVLHGNSFGPLDTYFEKGLINKHPVYSTKQMLTLLLKKRVDAAICNKTTLPGLVKQSGHSMDDFKILETPLYTFRLHLLVNRKKSTFLHDFNEFLKNNPLPELQEGG